MADPKSEFKNVTEGFIGVSVKDPASGRMRGISVQAGGTVWLDEDEQRATANAPRRDEDNPFTNGSLELLTKATAVANRRPIGDSSSPQPQEASAAGQEPPADAAEGSGGEDSAPEESSEAGEAESGETAPEPEEKPQEEPPAAPEGSREPTKEEQEASARAAAARQRPPAANETGAAPAPKGKPAQGTRAPSEEVGTPEATQKA